MPKYQTISQALFDQRSKEAIDRTPIRKAFSLKNIEVVNNTTLSLDGKQVDMTQDAFKGICKIVGLPVGFDRTFSSAFGEKARQQLVNRLKVAAQAKGNTEVSLVLNPSSRSIVGVQKDPRDLVSNETFLSTSTSIINKYGLEVNDFSIGFDGGVTINTSSPKNVWSLEGLSDEEFFGGITFSNSPNSGFEVSPFLHRLVCANGMIGRSFEETLRLGQMDGFTMEKFWTNLNNLAESGFRPSKFEASVRNAMNTKASLSELEIAHDYLKSYSDAEHKELEAWVPLHNTRARFHSSGIDTITMSPAQKKGAKTGTNVWDLVNGMTHFASHDNGFKIEDKNRRLIQVKAADILTKKYDMANIIPSPF